MEARAAEVVAAEEAVGWDLVAVKDLAREAL